MARFAIDKPALHDWYVRQLEEQLYSFGYDDEHGGMHLAEMFIEVCDAGGIVVPEGIKVCPMGFDEFEDPACIVIFLRADPERAPGWGFPMLHEIDDYFDGDDLIKGEIMTLAQLEVAVEHFVFQLNELDRWRLIAR